MPSGWCRNSFQTLGSIHILTELLKPSETWRPYIKGPSAFSSGEAGLGELSPQPFFVCSKSQLPERSPYLRQLHFLFLRSQLKARRWHSAEEPIKSPRFLCGQASFIKMNFVPWGFVHGGVVVYLITVPMATGSQWEGNGYIYQHLPVKWDLTSFIVKHAADNLANGTAWIEFREFWMT